jgi:iron complex outermembrane recepter protein
MKKTTHRLLALLCFIAFSVALHAQQKKTVTGVVRDNTGVGLPGVTITEKGTNNRVITDANGNYSISVSSQSTLVISYVGFTTKEVLASDPSITSISLLPGENALSEIVITGFGVRKQTRKLAYSISEVKGDELARANNANVINALQGKVAGVMINQGASGPQSSSRIRIRGNSSISNTNTQPLVVVDGVLIEPSTTGNDSWGENPDFGNIMKNLNPDDYESVTVLKGAAASALYGSKAGNGVLLITTKKGRQRKGLGVSFSHSESYDKAYKLYDLQNQFGGGISTVFQKDANGVDIVDPIAAYWNGGYSYGPAFDGHMVKDVDGRMIPWKANNPLDFFETGKYINSNVAVEGGSDVTTFRFSYSNLHNSSVLPNNALDRNSFALRATQKVGKILSLDASVNYSNVKSKNPARNGSNENPLFAFTYYRPRHADISYYTNNYIDPAGGYRGRSDPANLDPYALSRTAFRLFEDNRTRSENNLIANIDLSANVTPWLNFLVRTNANLYNDRFERKQLGEGANFSGGAYQLSQTSYTTYRIQGLANINIQFGNDFDLNFSIGGETYRNLGNNFSNSQTEGGLKVPGLFTISNSTNTASTTGVTGAGRRTDAVYAYGDLTWNNMLTLSASGRNDWSSTLTYRDGHGDHSYFYPSVGLAWIFTELPAFKDAGSSILSFGKLRTSFSYTGVDAQPQLTNSAGYYGLVGQFNSSGTTNRPIYTFNSGTIGNPDLKNELSRELEFGADIRFFKNRLGFDIAYYKKNTFNQILELPVPVESGASSKLLQAGNVQNQGIEVLVTANPLKTKYFNWNSTINFTRNRNKIIELYPGVSSKELELAFGADVVAKAIEGQEYGVVETGYAFATYQAKDGDGKPISHPNNGKRVIGSAPNGSTNGAYTFMRTQDYDGTRKILGSIMEKFLLSTTQEFSYKNFNLNVQVDSKVGGLMASATHQYGSSNGSLKNSLFGRTAELGGVQYDDNGVTKNDGIIPDGVLNDGITVTVGGQTVDLGGMAYAEAVNKGYLKPIPAYVYYENLTQWSSGIREYSVFENSWVALREVSIGYNLPASMIKKIKFNSLRVSITGRNLGYLYKTAKDGINPEGIFTNRAAGFAEYGGWPYVRSLGFNISAGF